MTPPQRSLPSPSARWLLGLVALAMCLAALAMGAGSAAAGRAQAAAAKPGVAGIAGAADTRAQRLAGLRASLRDLHRAADRSVAKPPNPFLRLGFTVSVVAAKVEIDFASSSRDLAGEARLAQRVLAGELRRVHAAWRAADATPQVNAIVRQLNELTADAARASGKRTNAEISAFKKAHLADVKYAGRRWIVDREIGRQGAVIISRGVRNARLRRVIEQMYRRGASVGDGGTADKLLDEVRAGCRARDCEHFIKATERRQGLMTILSEEPLSVTERQIAGELIGALTKAIRAAGGK